MQAVPEEAEALKVRACNCSRRGTGGWTPLRDNVDDEVGGDGLVAAVALWGRDTTRRFGNRGSAAAASRVSRARRGKAVPGSGASASALERP